MDLLIVYIACFALGLLYVLFSAIAGHFLGAHEGDGADIGSGSHGDAGVGGDPVISPLSPTTLAAFITSFGGIGMILSRIEATRSPLLSIPLSLLGGLIIAALVFYLFRMVFVRTQGSSESLVANLAGREATVITPIAPGSVGEIAYVDGGVRYTAAARCEGTDPLSTGSTVIIQRIVGNQFFVAARRPS